MMSTYLPFHLHCATAFSTKNLAARLSARLRPEQWVALALTASLPVLTLRSVDDHRSVLSFSPGVLRRGVTWLYDGGFRMLGLLEAESGPSGSVVPESLSGDHFSRAPCCVSVSRQDARIFA